MKAKTKVSTLAATIITLGSLAGGANAAITMQLVSADDSRNVTFSISGSLDLHEGFAASNTNIVSLTNSNGGRRGFGETVFPTTNAAFDGASLGDWVITGEIPTILSSDLRLVFENGNAPDRFEDTIGVFSFSSSDGFVLRTENFNNYDLDNDTSSISFNGSMTLFTSQDFVNTFNKGNYSSSYNGQDVSLIISNVPEPSSALLLGLGALGMAARRRRTS